MKNLIPLTLLFLVVAFCSCSKEQINKDTPDSTADYSVISSALPELLYSVIEEALEDMGFTEVSLPGGFIPDFPAAQTVHRWTNGTDEWYCYKWNTWTELENWIPTTANGCT